MTVHSFLFSWPLQQGLDKSATVYKDSLNEVARSTQAAVQQRAICNELEDKLVRLRAQNEEKSRVSRDYVPALVLIMCRTVTWINMWCMHRQLRNLEIFSTLYGGVHSRVRAENVVAFGRMLIAF